MSGVGRLSSAPAQAPASGSVAGGGLPSPKSRASPILANAAALRAAGAPAAAAAAEARAAAIAGSAAVPPAQPSAAIFTQRMQASLSGAPRPAQDSISAPRQEDAEEDETPRVDCGGGLSPNRGSIISSAPASPGAGDGVTVASAISADIAPHSADAAVRVVVRCRPPRAPGEPSFALVQEAQGPNKCSLKLAVPDTMPEGLETSDLRRFRSSGPRNFRCNAYLGAESTQQDVFEQAVLVADRVMEGYNATIFCYGVTGSGKTYTMSGPPEDISRPRSPDSNGIAQRVSRRIFEYIRDRSSLGEVFVVEASFLEIYSSDGNRETLVDLLSEADRKLEVRQDPLNLNSFLCEGLRKVPIRTPDEMCELLTVGQKRCTMMETTRNLHSSRSHCLFMLSIESLAEAVGSSAPVVQRGKLMLVDLAGSESLKKVQAASNANEELRKTQAIGINRVLSSLGTVVNNMNIGLAPGVRGCSLTMLLSDCLGGNARALLVANLGPELESVDEAVKTLTFAQQFMAVKNVANVNRIDQEQSALMQMRARHAECIQILQAPSAGGGDSEQQKRLQQEMEDLNARLLTKSSAEQTLEQMRTEQFRKMDEMRDEMAQVMTKELEKMRRQSLTELDRLKQSMEQHVSHLDGASSRQATEEHRSELERLQAEQQDCSRQQRVAEDEASGLRVRLAAANERCLMLRDRTEELERERDEEDRHSDPLQADHQRQRLANAEAEVQRYQAEAEAQKAEVARRVALRADEAEAARRERDAWRTSEAELLRQTAALRAKVNEAQREAEVQALRVEGERQRVISQLHLQIERLSADAAQRAERLEQVRVETAQIESVRSTASQRAETLKRQGVLELQQCQEELEEAKNRETELLQMLHEVQDGVISGH